MFQFNQLADVKYEVTWKERSLVSRRCLYDCRIQLVLNCMRQQTLVDMGPCLLLFTFGGTFCENQTTRVVAVGAYQTITNYTCYTRNLFWLTHETSIYNCPYLQYYSCFPFNWYVQRLQPQLRSLLVQQTPPYSPSNRRLIWHKSLSYTVIDLWRDSIIPEPHRHAACQCRGSNKGKNIFNCVPSAFFRNSSSQ